MANINSDFIINLRGIDREVLQQELWDYYENIQRERARAEREKLIEELIAIDEKW